MHPHLSDLTTKLFWQVIRFLFRGQIPINPKTGEVIEDIEKATRQVMENLKAILTEVGATFDDVVKTSIFLSDMHQFGKVNAVYAQYFDEETAPARETVEVANLPKFVNVEISCIAVLPVI